MCITPDMKLREGLGMGHIQRVGYAGISSAPLQVQLILKELWRVMNQESIPEGIHLFARLSHCNSSWIESLRTPGKSWFFASGSVFDPRAVWFIRPPGGTHRCLVLQPMNMTLLEMMRMNPRPFDLPLLKMTVRRLLLSLDFLHAEADVIHTGRDLHSVKVGFWTNVH